MRLLQPFELDMDAVRWTLALPRSAYRRTGERPVSPEQPPHPIRRSGAELLFKVSPEPRTEKRISATS